MEPNLMVIGLNHRTAPVAVRERFFISETRRCQALVELSHAEGIDEVVVLATCNRTEFIVWSSEPSVAANSIRSWLTREYGLKLCEWQHFYRLLDEAALVHIFRVASSLDSMIIGEPQIISQVKAAWNQAQQVSTTGRFLDAVLQKALTVSKRVRNETNIGSSAVSVPYAAVELAKQIFGSLEDRIVLLLGAGKMSELSARYLVNNGARQVRVINRTFEHAAEIAEKLGGVPVAFEDRWPHLVEADIVISSTGCPHIILSKDEVQRIVHERAGRPLCLVDIAVPRDIDPEVKHVSGVFLYDVDDLEQVVKHNAGERLAAAEDGQKIVTAEAHEFRRKLQAERVVPTIVALRQHLDEICRQELDSFCHEFGPFSQDENRDLHTVTSRITQRIAGSLARELKELPEKVEQEQMTAAVQRLFHLGSPAKALAGANIGKGN
ncbi:MAG TPA: glutamyl-tRNA reductase [Terriglobales bacterium]|nr:glutamyl-tRNA reductase [Terriglobales bacterium]